MNGIITFTFVAGLLVSPVILLQAMVMPQLEEMRQFYRTMDNTVQNITDGATSSSIQTTQAHPQN